MSMTTVHRRGGRSSRALGVLAVALAVASVCVSPALAQDHAFLSSYAILAHDPGTGQVGVAAASRGISVASGVLAVETGLGAAVVQGSIDGRAVRRALDALRDGDGPDGAVAAALGQNVGPVQVGVLTASCESSIHSVNGAYPPASTSGGNAAGICYLALGTLTPTARVVRVMGSAFEDAVGPMSSRLIAALQAAERLGGDIPASESAALWISAPDAASGAFGRAELRLQIDGQQGAVAVLAQLAARMEGDHLARQASEMIAVGDYGQSAVLASRGTELDPQSSFAWMTYGRALLFDGREEEAEAAFRRMLELDPFLLLALGNPGSGQPRAGVIPFSPRLLTRLNAYRKAFFSDADFAKQP